jgi:hypothetical protein
MMRKCLVVLLSAILVAVFALPAMADISFFGTAKVKPTYYTNFDFDDNRPDAPALNEGGWASGEHIRSELRLGWKAGGDKWKIMMIAEADVINEKDTADRSFYVGAEKDGQPNTGGEFGIERFEANYTFSPACVLSTGWNIRAADIKTGGLLFGDDHPFIEIGGKLTQNLGYALTYITVQNRDEIAVSDATVTDDWRAYLLKVNANVGSGDVKGTLSPIFLLSDNRGAGSNGATIYYYGIEATGQIGIFKPSFEFIYADGEFRGTSLDIKAYAAFAGVEAGISKVFKPYVALRFASGDDNSSDNDVEGFVGVTDIGRFTPLMGMDGNILGEHLASGASPYNAPLYSFSPGRDNNKLNASDPNNVYGGIGNGSSGNNPGQMLLAFGAKGAISEPLSYKAQVFLIWYDQTKNIPVGAGKTMSEVDDYAGTTFDLQVKYAFSKNFAVDLIYSAFAPGDGIKDQLSTSADDTIAQLGMLTLAWSY